MAGYSECGNDPSGFIQCGEFRDIAEDVLNFSGWTTDKLYELSCITYRMVRRYDREIAALASLWNNRGCEISPLDGKPLQSTEVIVLFCGI